jgi:hypothetical protein
MSQESNAFIAPEQEAELLLPFIQNFLDKKFSATLPEGTSFSPEKTLKPELAFFSLMTCIQKISLEKVALDQQASIQKLQTIASLALSLRETNSTLKTLYPHHTFPTISWHQHLHAVYEVIKEIPLPRLPIELPTPQEQPIQSSVLTRSTPDTTSPLAVETKEQLTLDEVIKQLKKTSLRVNFYWFQHTHYLATRNAQGVLQTRKPTNKEIVASERVDLLFDREERLADIPEIKKDLAYVKFKEAFPRDLTHVRDVHFKQHILYILFMKETVTYLGQPCFTVLMGGDVAHDNVNQGGMIGLRLTAQDPHLLEQLAQHLATNHQVVIKRIAEDVMGISPENDYMSKKNGRIVRSFTEGEAVNSKVLMKSISDEVKLPI